MSMSFRTQYPSGAGGAPRARGLDSWTPRRGALFRRLQRILYLELSLRAFLQRSWSYTQAPHRRTFIDRAPGL